ncbi:NAD-dependent epimerase/dehydratase family protein [Geomobilimonas luticola]|uniref:NAD(P)-dependent oxidoreductase n=1 Tax=Geomobilimonas luticola TaxID=1114878 RepID=A0ABS5SEJ0_9BACT|nr:NAD(P)-dependent oxidoreductase [Geomobilimonas luticola]MBT0653786.1 NAD(P)-dependent oxidoreductase [Geomobilimonas luticola]
MASRKALLTGATGFIGSHVARRLVESGWSVHVILRADSDLSPISGILDRITVHRHDGSTEGLEDIVRQVAPDTVFHLASLFLAQHRPEDVESLVRSNVLFGAQLLEAMVKHGVRRLVNTGTSWQHYESRDYSPVNLYAATKQAFEDILRYYVEATSLRAISLKLFDTYGPGDPRPKLFTLLRRVAQEQQPLAMSPGEQLIDLVYIDDVTDAFLMAAERLLADLVPGHESYAVSSGAPVRLRELVETYGRVLDRPLPIQWGGRSYREREVMVPWNAGKSLPGWRPKVGLEEGIERMEGAH